MKVSDLRCPLLLLGVALSGQASAALTFTERSAFEAALGARGLRAHVEDYQGYAAGTTIDSSGGTLGHYAYSASVGGAGLDLVISDLFSPGDRYLGVGDGLDELFFDGDSLAFGFAPTIAFGLDILHEGNAVDGDLTLSFAGTDLGLVAGAPLQQVYFLGIIDTGSEFTTASLTSDTGRVFTWNVDSLTVPAPSGLSLVLLGGLLAWLSRGRAGQAARSRNRAPDQAAGGLP